MRSASPARYTPHFQRFGTAAATAGTHGASVAEEPKGAICIDIGVDESKVYAAVLEEQRVEVLQLGEAFAKVTAMDAVTAMASGDTLPARNMCKALGTALMQLKGNALCAGVAFRDALCGMTTWYRRLSPMERIQAD